MGFEMKNNASLSPEMQRAKALYNSSYILGMLVASSLSMISWFMVVLLFHRLGFGHLAPYFSPYGHVVVIVAGMCGGQWWSLRQLRRAELSQETKTVEIVTKTASVFSGEPIEWHSSQTLAHKIALASVPLMMSIAGWGMWRSFEDYWVLRVQGAALFVGFIASGLWMLFRRPFAFLIDEEGVVASSSRRLFWKDVASCEIWRHQDIFGESIGRSFVFKNEQGKVLLKFSSQYLELFTLQEQMQQIEEITTEIKRRLTSNSLVGN